MPFHAHTAYTPAGTTAIADCRPLLAGSPFRFSLASGFGFDGTKIRTDRPALRETRGHLVRWLGGTFLFTHRSGNHHDVDLSLQAAS